MTKLDTVKQIVAALESDDPRRVGEYLADDFVFIGPFPGPLDRDQFLEYVTATRRAFPDWSYHFSFVQEEAANSIKGVIQRQGTHKADFSLPGMVTIPATDISVILPLEPVHFVFKDDKLVRMEIEDASGGGLEGILEQLGAELPRCLHGIFNKHPETV